MPWAVQRGRRLAGVSWFRRALGGRAERAWRFSGSQAAGAWGRLPPRPRAITSRPSDAPSSTVARRAAKAQAQHVGRMLATLGVAVLWVGCDAGVPAAATPAPTVLGERTYVQADRPTQDVGEDCEAAGASACHSGLCIVAPRTDGTVGAHVCSTACAKTSECPQGWACQRPAPGVPTRICMPPLDFAP